MIFQKKSSSTHAQKVFASLQGGFFKACQKYFRSCQEGGFCVCLFLVFFLFVFFCWPQKNYARKIFQIMSLEGFFSNDARKVFQIMSRRVFQMIPARFFRSCQEGFFK